MIWYGQGEKVINRSQQPYERQRLSTAGKGSNVFAFCHRHDSLSEFYPAHRHPKTCYDTDCVNVLLRQKRQPVSSTYATRAQRSASTSTSTTASHWMSTCPTFVIPLTSSPASPYSRRRPQPCLTPYCLHRLYNYAPSTFQLQPSHSPHAAVPLHSTPLPRTN